MGGKNKKGNVGNWEDYNRRENEWRKANSFPSSTWEGPYQVDNPPPPPQYKIPYQPQEPQYYNPQIRSTRNVLRFTGFFLLALITEGFLWVSVLAIINYNGTERPEMNVFLPVICTVALTYIFLNGIEDEPPIIDDESDRDAFGLGSLVIFVLQMFALLAFFMNGRK